MTAHFEDAATDLRRQVAALERELQVVAAERDEAFAQQAAIADILKVIASSPSDVQPVFEAIATSANRLLRGHSTTVTRYMDAKSHIAAFTPVSPEADAALVASYPRLLKGNAAYEAVRDGGTFKLPDVEAADPDGMRDQARLRGWRSVTAVPLSNRGTVVGSIAVTRAMPGALADDDIQLLQTFADQTVIAIENARMFRETQEALERQTATSEILRVISQSPTDARPVFDSISFTAVRSLHCDIAFVLMRDGDAYIHTAGATPDGPMTDLAPDRVPIDPNANFPSRAILAKETLYFPDWSLIDLPEHERNIRAAFGINSALYLPLLREGECIGMLGVGGSRVNPFGPKEIAQAESFRDQALIAIENARLFNETQEALERQTATAEVLKVIASSPSDVQPVFDAIAASANRLLGGFSTAVFRVADATVHLAAFTPTNPRADEAFKALFPLPIANVTDFGPLALVAEGEVAEIPETQDAPPLTRELARLRGYRSMLFAPLMANGVAVGVISVTRKDPGVFAADDVKLLRTFADQAVIAIQNARLFNETQEALEQQRASAEVLDAIGRSVSDAEPVFEKILDACQRLFGSSELGIYTIGDDEMVRVAAWRGPRAEEVRRDVTPLAESVTGRIIKDRRTHHIPDISAEPNLSKTVRERVARHGGASMVYAPMLWEERGLGSILVVRSPPKPFSERERALLQTFANQAAIAIENARLFRETKEALERQTASAEILRVISSSPTDVQPVFDAIARSAAVLCEGINGTVFRLRDGLIHLVGHYSLSQAQLTSVQQSFPAPLNRGTASGRAILEGAVVHIHDIAADPEYTVASLVKTGLRSVLAVPMRRNSETIGSINVSREEPRPFSDRQIELLRTFADQAVIAISNVALFNETQEALRQQTATGDILRVIASSPNDLQPVLDKIVETACRLCNAYDAVALLREGDQLRVAAHHGPIPITFTTQQINRGWASGRAVIERRAIHIDDFAKQADEYPVAAALSSRGGAPGSDNMLWRANLAMPLMREGEAIGVIGLRRIEALPFSEGQTELLKTFSDQAVIAIQNARLFDEVQARTRDLTEALQQQTATADVLKVISRSAFDLQTVLDTLVASAARLCEAEKACINLRQGEVYRWVSNFGFPEELVTYARSHPLAAGGSSTTSRVARDKHPVHIPDVLADPDYAASEYQRLGNYRTMLGVPLLRESEPIGVFIMTREAVRPFNQRQIDLLTTFADQAVIAIENVRLFDEVQARTRDLTEALQQQTATADVLKAISRTAFDLDAVLDTLILTAARLCDAKYGEIFRRQADVYRYAAHLKNAVPGYVEHEEAAEIRPGRGTLVGRVALERRAVLIPDAWSDPDYAEKDQARMGDVRSMLGVPLMRDGEPIGAFALARSEPVPFTQRQVELVTTFADQAVIAIENVRLFDEVQARTRDLTEALRQQTATAEVLKVISRSAFDLQKVLDTLAASAVSLCGARGGIIFLKSGDRFELKAVTDESLGPALFRFLRETPLRPGRGTAGARVLLTGEVQNIPDVLADPEFDPAPRELIANRALLGVPLKRGEDLVGAFVLARADPGAFTERQIQIVQTFADQAVIAIENVRLFDEVQARTRDLTEALEHQTATSEVLSAISRSPTEVQPVFDAIARSATELCEATSGGVDRFDGSHIHLAAHYNWSPEALEAMRQIYPVAPGRGFASARAVLTRAVVHIPDIAEDREYTATPVVKVGFRTVLAVPMIRDSQPIGAIAVVRLEKRPFTERQIALLQTFAEQAVIAINNVRLFDEVQARTRDLTEALQQQTATADVLKVISRSAFDLQPVFDTIAESAVRLCEAERAVIFQFDGNLLRAVASHNVGPELWQFVAGNPVAPGRNSISARAALYKRTIRVTDVQSDPEYTYAPRDVDLIRAIASVPMIKGDELVGTITIFKLEARPFTDKQIALVETFAEQAVIAIENVRLFDEVQARTRDLSEALQMQTATSDVLKVISRSAFDLQAVFNTLVSSAVELGGALTGTICVREGDVFRYRDTIGAEHTSALAQYLKDHPATPGRSTIAGRVLLSGKVERIPDCLADPDYVVPMGSLANNVRSLLGVPLLRKQGVEGAIILTRDQPGDFTDRQVEIVQTFADQAVIALENVRLFDEVQARTKELSASLDDLRKAQDRLIQSEKLASLGQLTAGIAHEIKNPLNFINNFSALSRELLDELREALDKAPLETTVAEEAQDLIGMVASNLDKVVSHGRRADSIVKNMLLHSREGSGERSSVNINAMVEEALNLAYHGARAEKPGFNVTIAKSLDPQAGSAEIYPQEMTRVLLNLISNGFYATTKRKQAQVNGSYEPTITASTRDLGHSVEIAVRDNGTGIPDEVKAKMFNPFFTTKPAGEGTGLGLSLSHDIVVKQHGGSMEVRTEPGAFTQFTILLPRTAPAAPANGGAAA